MTNDLEKPFIDYLNAVDTILQSKTGQTSDQPEMDEIAGAQECGMSPSECAEALVRRFRIRELNDLCRTAMGVAGRVYQTPGVCALPEVDQSAIREQVEHFNSFTEDNDPHGEHDFGAFKHNGQTIFWKIDYYDHTLNWGSEDPADPAKTIRVLTIMLAEEW